VAIIRPYPSSVADLSIPASTEAKKLEFNIGHLKMPLKEI